MPKRLVIISLYLLLVGSNVFSQTQGVAKVDSLVMAYYNKCLDAILDPIVLSMSDTLFTMAEQDGDKRMQAVALCTKLDHYYYSQSEHKLDSITAWVKRVQNFAKQTNQPKYYYFVWTGRLINYHILLGEYNIALIETEKTLKEAENEGYMEGIADCYSALSNIYSAKQLSSKSQEFVLKEIEIYEKYNLDRYNISIKYSSAGRTFSNNGKTEEALEYLRKGEKTVNTSYHKLQNKLAFANYYLDKNELDQVHKILEECKTMYATDKSLARYSVYLYSPQTAYYRATKNYQEALRSIDRWEETLINRNEDASLKIINRVRAEIYWDMGKKEAAAESYRKVLNQFEEEITKNEEITTAEFATLLNMQKLTTEKNELEQLSRDRQLQQTRTLIISLIVLLSIVIFFLYRQSKLNRQLKKSRDTLNEKNQILLKAEEELRHAKEAAEENSHMKSIFIQNMSHEIRTPLNSIVGFSSVLSEMFSEGDDEVQQYSLMIEKNSLLLLKMINDILDISDLDENNDEIEYSPVNINKCCLSALEETAPLLEKGVSLFFSPSSDNLVIQSNEGYLMQVLNNLLNNAAKFTLNGNITLAFNQDQEKKELIFSVTDTGIGIPLEQQEHVFDRFTKQNDFTQGTGLGLSICKMIASKMEGYLIIDKDYTEGARFIFGIPIEHPEN